MSFNRKKLIDDITTNEIKAKLRTSNYKKKAFAYDMTKESDVEQLVYYANLVNCSAFDIETHNIERTVTRDEQKNMIYAYIRAIHDTEKVVMLSREDHNALLANQKKTRKKKTT